MGEVELMSKRRTENLGEPAWKSIRYGFLVILMCSLVFTVGQLILGSTPSWNSTGPAGITVGVVGVAGTYIARAL
ncbi:MAG: hypothetical protein L0G94_18460, partial [Brachybacterium sp.]|uniref:hypothetical protein n=1 Tax=Brachybacterium sp. TaxID=1891286 RepID=UPI0026482653